MNTARKEKREPQNESRSKQKYESLIAALLTHSTVAEAARSANVSETTIWRMRQDPEFQKQYDEAQKRVLDGALNSIQGAVSKAVQCLERNLTCGMPAAEVQASRALLSYGIKTQTIKELEIKVSHLENQLEAYEKAKERQGDDEE